MPRISFIVVCADRPKSLRTCLASISDQTLSKKEWEVIVVDNSSTEELAAGNIEVCDQIWERDNNKTYEYTGNDTRIDRPNIRHKRCLYTATEIGVSMATGEYMCFPSQDDYVTPVFAERMLAVADETGAELVLCDVVLGGPGHGYFTLGTSPRSCAVDKSSFILRRDKFGEGFTGKWDNYELEDGFFIERLVAQGVKVAKCAQVLVCHN
jgi:glycosyltransferase involved in cell wall biosynthesis